MTRVRRWVILIVPTVAIAGCGESPPPPASDAVVDSAAADSAVPSPSHSDPQDAAAALKTVVDGFQQNRPETIWEFLPPSHQREINELAREFSARMDADLWRKTANVGRESAGLLKTRKQSFLSHPALRDSQWGADGTLSRKWDGLVALLVTVTSGELADLEKMKTFDGAQFFSKFDAVTLAQLQELSILLGRDNPFSLLPEMTDGAKIETLLEINDQAVVEIHPQKGKSRRFPFRRVEGKWLPELWAEELLVDIRRAKGRLDTELAPSVLALKKEIVLPHLENAQSILAQLKMAETDEAFHSVMTVHIIKPALQVGGNEHSDGTAPVNLAGEASDVVTIVVSGDLTPTDVVQIEDALLNISDVDFDLTTAIEEGKTTFVLSPVTDVAAIARAIQFGKVLEVDAKGRKIAVDVTPPPKK